MLGIGGDRIISRAHAADQNDSPGASLDVRVPLLRTERLEESKLLEFFKSGFEPAFEFGRCIGSAQTDVLAGQGSQVEVKSAATIEPLVKKTIHPLGCREDAA